MRSIHYSGIKDQELAEWYFNTSLLFVGSEHQYWEKNKSRRKKYGNCRPATGDVISTVMLNSQEEVTTFMLSKITVETTKHDDDDDKSRDNKNRDGQEEGVPKAV
ncbi:hypothetical protein B9Z19DRAFT_992447 [Tuber borchii]|uniref:Arb2-like domain-containing protein n=1 Tax=Tuber borchii TaxID=42251 RepID=A0A2T6ZKE4_TUBBO|nr:hypothetical protein B9Z19DRAFT_992447 [Tuber borchii]